MGRGDGILCQVLQNGNSWKFSSTGLGPGVFCLGQTEKNQGDTGDEGRIGDAMVADANDENHQRIDKEKKSA